MSADISEIVRAQRLGLAERLRRAREAKGLTQDEAAERLGETQGTISNREKGRVPVDDTALISMADLYGVRVSDLRPPDQTERGPIRSDDYYDGVVRSVAVMGRALSELTDELQEWRARRAIKKARKNPKPLVEVSPVRDRAIAEAMQLQQGEGKEAPPHRRGKEG